LTIAPRDATLILRFSISMIACNCHGVSERVVDQHVRDGACSIIELGRRTGAGSSCGRCHERLDALLARRPDLPGRAATHDAFSEQVAALAAK
jgi:bacterioferritin-associated ferredoxin